jgi:hypothetical protein
VQGEFEKPTTLMGATIEQLWIEIASVLLWASSPAHGLGSNPQITISASGFWMCRELAPFSTGHLGITMEA